MRKVLLEYGRLPRSELPERLLLRLQWFDERNAQRTGACIFDWNHVRYIRALSFVGVVQVPGLTIEILPKVDTSVVDGNQPVTEATRSLAQQNLLYMLSVAHRVPLHDRDLASLAVQKLPLLEALTLIFVEQLFGELRRGIDRTYVRREENLPFFKGKLLISRHLELNVARQERCFVAFDEFLPDTWLNRILKAGCQRLLAVVGSSRVQQRLREALVLLGGVSDIDIRNHHFDKVHLNRNTQRFEVLLNFARLVLLGSAPSPACGVLPTFSLLFPMEVLFEEFIAGYLKRHALEFGIRQEAVYIQAVRRRKWLLRGPEGQGRFRLKPDVVIHGESRRPAVILDTKWKRLLRHVADVKNGISQADLYQLYAYATRYGCPDNILLFPRVDGVSPKSYTVPDTGTRLRVEFVDVSRNLRRNQKALIADLAAALDLNVGSPARQRFVQ